MRTSVSIALFFVLSAFFLFALLAALNRSRRSLIISSVCLVSVVCIIVFLTPVRLPSWIPHEEKEGFLRHIDTMTTTTESGETSGSLDGTSDTTAPEGGL